MLINLIPGVPILNQSRTVQWTQNMSIWDDIVLLTKDTEDHQPLLMINTTGVYTAPDIEKMENETLKEFQILKVIHNNKTPKK